MNCIYSVLCQDALFNFVVSVSRPKVFLSFVHRRAAVDCVLTECDSSCGHQIVDTPIGNILYPLEWSGNNDDALYSCVVTPGTK